VAHWRATAIALATIIVFIIVVFSWRISTTTERIAALEEQLQQLTGTLDNRLTASDGRHDEMGLAIKKLEGRVDHQLRSEQLTVTSSNSTLPTGEAPTLQQARDIFTDSVDGSGSEKEEPFQEMFRSIRDSLKLDDRRWAEVATELELALKSFWPEYVALSKSQNPDTAGLRQRYCSRVEMVLEAEEAARLGCGGDQVMNPVYD